MSTQSIKNQKSKIKNSQLRVGVDTGGTFTDFVFEASDGLRVFKLASTPADPSLAIIEGLLRVADETGAKPSEIEVIHGTTVGTNALLERRGARTALVTTAGFEDVLAIGRQARPSLYNLNAERPAPLVPSSLRFGVRERVSAFGEILEELEEHAIRTLVQKLRKARVESIAICLLFSFIHPEHEKRLAEALSALEIPLSISHQILPEYREFERTSTVTINAYLQPLMGRYLKRLQKHAPHLRVMQSSGGSISALVAGDEPVRTILSGPAGGVVGALGVARACGVNNTITFDMGGTSTDVALCDRTGMRMTREALLAGMPVAVSMMDIQTVGAGGGSIARVDEGGSLRVGPESAGADPGPACYGKSLLPTVTDAHLVLGHFGGAGLLGGEWKLDEARARKALGQLAKELSAAASRKLSMREAAQGVLRVVSVNMERALRAISVDAFAELIRVEAPQAPLEAIALCHPMDYVTAIRDATPKEGMCGSTPIPPCRREATRRRCAPRAAPCTRSMKSWPEGANNAFVATRPPGHHAETARPMGFCLFNNAAIAARHAQKQHGVERVAVMDFDVHHGNGSQEIFWSDKHRHVLVNPSDAALPRHRRAERARRAQHRRQRAAARRRWRRQVSRRHGTARSCRGCAISGPT